MRLFDVPDTLIAGSGGPDYSSDMQARVRVLEEIAANTKALLSEIKAEQRSGFSEMRTEQRAMRTEMLGID